MPDEKQEETTSDGEGSAFTPEQKREMMNLINRGLTAASKVHGAKLEKSFGTFAEEIRGVIQAAQATIPPDGQEKGKMDPSIAAELAALKKQNEAVQAALKAERDEKEAIKAHQREQEARGELNRLIRAAGVNNDDLLAGASEILYKRIGRAEDGSLFMRVKRDGIEEELPLDKAVSEWTKGQGKAFLPATQAKGSGQQRVASNGHAANNPVEAYERGRDRALGAILDAVTGTTMPASDRE